MRITRSAVAFIAAAGLLLPQVAHGGTQAVDAEVLKRGNARPPGTSTFGEYVRTRSEYRALWEEFGFRDDRPAVNFERRRVVFVATTDSSSCPLWFRNVRVDRDNRRLVVHLTNRVPDYEPCTDDLRFRSFVIALDRDDLPRGDLTVRVARH